MIIKYNVNYNKQLSSIRHNSVYNYLQKYINSSHFMKLRFNFHFQLPTITDWWFASPRRMPYCKYILDLIDFEALVNEL